MLKRTTLCIFTGVLLLASAPQVMAQSFDHTFRLEAGVGVPVGTPGSDRFNTGAGFGFGYELRLMPYVGVELHHDSYFFPTQGSTGAGYGGYHGTGLGARVHPLPDLSLGDLALGARATLVFTGDVVRPGMEFDISFEIVVMPALRVGPFVRYAHVFQTDPAQRNLGDGDGRFLLIGVSGAYTVDGESAPPPDADGDGLLDDVDQCPAQPEDMDGFGDEDGCPDPDNDGDGVEDTSDGCPLQAEDSDQFEDQDGCPDLDNDGDGILDEPDQCPLEAEDMNGQDDEDGCPDADRDDDEDHIVNLSDQCPDVAEDVDGFEDEDGCPDPDNDGDGVLDVDDQCPLAPAPHQPDGCPTSVRVEEHQIRILQRIQFDTNRARIRHRSFSILEQVAAVLSANPQITHIRVEGHTDTRGSDSFNTRLSQQRAESVVAWLAAHGVDAGRMVAQGFGGARPLEDNGSQAGRQSNRRVEFHIGSDE